MGRICLLGLRSFRGIGEDFCGFVADDDHGNEQHREEEKRNEDQVSGFHGIRGG